ncbi:hypothetical protein QRK45_004555 [Escherichia coli]|nr:hypothetical protein [Escherichia coli]
MLEKDYQLSAYKKLAAAGGMKTPGAITSARNSANTAKLLAEELTGLILDTIVYPDTITSFNDQNNRNRFNEYWRAGNSARGPVGWLC